jgi:hypothetical protein
MWRLGLDLTPPPFAGFATNALVMGTGFGIIWGLLMWPLASWTAPPWFAVAVTVIAGAAFGIAMATYYRWRMKPLGLPRWEDYPGVGTGTGTGH